MTTGTSGAADRWFEISNVGDIPSPALLIYADRVEENIRRMLTIAGGPERLRPHIKTHKMGEIVRLQAQKGILKCKAATIAEAELAARYGATDILLAFQPVGPNIQRLLALKKKYPDLDFSAIVDTERVVQELARASEAAGTRTALYLDINCGMNRTGIPAGPEALRIYEGVSRSPSLRAAGLHAYDGHIHDHDPLARRKRCDEAFAPVAALATELRKAGMHVPTIIAGGSPTFPIHAARDGVETSPGTTLFWDQAYLQGFPDIDILPAALVLSRVVSKPAKNLLCMDLGHKAVAAEMPHPRVTFLGLDDARVMNHSEEHLVIEYPGASHWNVGDHVYGIPTHICPTVARYDRGYVVRDGRVTEQWCVEARDRILSI